MIKSFDDEDDWDMGKRRIGSLIFYSTKTKERKKGGENVRERKRSENLQYEVLFKLCTILANSGKNNKIKNIAPFGYKFELDGWGRNFFAENFPYPRITYFVRS